MIDVLRRVFRHNRYRVVFLAITIIVIVVALLLPNRQALWQVLTSDALSFIFKLEFAWSLLGILSTNYSLVTGFYLFLAALMFALNIVLLTFYIRRRQEVTHQNKIHLSGLAGTVASILGIGCAACGSVVITSILGIFGAGSLVALLPFHGFEFGILGLLLLGVSIKYLFKKVGDPLVCPVKL